MLYQICNGTVAFAEKTVLDNINFEIRNTEKIAVVGRNGCGKTTLLNLIQGNIELSRHDGDTSSISKAGNLVIGCLKQMAFDNDDITVSEEIRKVFKPILDMKKEMDELLKEVEATQDPDKIQKYSNLQERFTYLGGYNYEKDYDNVVARFGFSEEDLAKKLSEFSGGQRTKIAFIKLLLSKPDVLLLDEPTNHLDISTISWLEGYLKEYPRAVVVVSHDRMFLDRVAEVVYEIEHHKMKRYVGNYSSFMEQKKKDYDKQLKDYEAQQKEIQRLNDIVDKFKNKPTKVAMTRSKLKMIEHMDLIDKPDTFDDRAFITNLIPDKVSGNDVLSVDNLGIGYDGKLISKVNLEVKKNQKIGIIGGNGLGKSTFLKTIMELIPKISGKYKYGYNVEIGYFDQQMAQYTSEKTVLDELWDEFPTLTETQVRNMLGGFLFRGDDVFKKVSKLSGGEKVRLALSKMFETKPNFLILDEPTNHMDIVGKEALEEMLKNYEGTVLFVSHDRYFVKQVADSLLIFENGTTTYFPFGYEAYEEKYGKEEVNDSKLQITFNNTEAPVKEKKDDSQKNYYNPGKEKDKRDRRIAKLESLIGENEEKIAALKEELSKPELASDYVKLAEIQGEIDKLEGQNNDYMDEWTELCD